MPESKSLMKLGKNIYKLIDSYCSFFFKKIKILLQYLRWLPVVSGSKSWARLCCCHHWGIWDWILWETRWGIQRYSHLNILGNIGQVCCYSAPPALWALSLCFQALEYAKKIPRPKTFITRPSEQLVKEPQAQTGTSLPQIPSLESLWNRHQREKEIVAAFKSLHIF